MPSAESRIPVLLPLALLGAFHGLNPAMGWLFAVALGLQDGRAASVLRALPPIALGHAASVASIIALVSAAQLTVPFAAVRIAGGLVLLGFGLYRFGRRGRHPRWVGMRVGFRDLTLWSFLMSSAHGAGLMLVPVLLGGARGATHAHPTDMPRASRLTGDGLAALGVHSAAMLLVMAGVALVVYRVLGLELLRRAWVNVDLLWAVALVAAGVVTLVV